MICQEMRGELNKFISVLVFVCVGSKGLIANSQLLKNASEFELHVF